MLPCRHANMTLTKHLSSQHKSMSATYPTCQADMLACLLAEGFETPTRHRHFLPRLYFYVTAHKRTKKLPYLPYCSIPYIGIVQMYGQQGSNHPKKNPTIVFGANCQVQQHGFLHFQPPHPCSLCGRSQ